MSSIDGSRDGSWMSRLLRSRTNRRACGFGVVICSFVVCLVGFLLASLAYYGTIPMAWAPLGLSCGVPASCICTFCFVYLLFCWNEGEVSSEDQDRIERSEPHERTPLLAEESAADLETPVEPSKLPDVVEESGTLESTQSEALVTESTEVTSESREQLTESALETEEKNKSTESAVKLQFEISGSSGASELPDSDSSSSRLKQLEESVTSLEKLVSTEAPKKPEVPSTEKPATSSEAESVPIDDVKFKAKEL